MNYKFPLVKNTFFQEKNTKKLLSKFILDSSRLSMSEECKKFEKDFAGFQNSKYSVFYSSGSAANLALIQSLKNLNYLKDGDKVAVASLTWATNVMPLIQLNLIPVPIDVELTTLNLDLKNLDKNYQKEKFKAIFLTNALSLSTHMDKLVNFCQKNNILLFEDNCESMGSEFKGKKLGNFGIAGTFSFYVGHQMSTIEGGCVTTGSEELYEMLKLVRAHGWSRDLNKKISNNDFYDKFTFYDLAYNLRPTEINGFLANLQLKFLNKNLKKRYQISKKIYQLLKDKESLYQIKILTKPFYPFAVPLIFNDKKEFEKSLKKFTENSIEIRPVISGNITKQPFYQKYFPGEYELPNCDIIHESGLYFGVNPDMTKEELNNLLEILDKIIK